MTGVVCETKFARFPGAVRCWAACPAAHVTRHNRFVAPDPDLMPWVGAASCFVHAWG